MLREYFYVAKKQLALCTNKEEVLLFISLLQYSILAESNTVEYGASKGAVVAMTRHMAADLGGMKIRVNAIAPGTIRTNLTGARLADQGVMERESSLTMLNRVGETEDIVGPAVFLASDESSFITGTHIFVDGGYSVK